MIAGLQKYKKKRTKKGYTNNPTFGIESFGEKCGAPSRTRGRA